VSSQPPSRLWIKAPAQETGCPTLGVPLFLRHGWGIALTALAFALPAAAQYPGQIAKPDANAPELRAVAVLEWTGDEEHPKASRLVPICIFDGQELQDAGVYLAQPQPLALESDVEYQLQQDGKPTGIFDVETSAREQGGWVGFGKWKSLPKPKPEPVKTAKVDEDNDAQSDVPVLHRKHRSDDSGSGAGAPSPDPDRPTLHKDGDSSADTSGDDNSASAPAPDPDRPTLHKLPDDSAGADGSPGGSGSPKLKKKKPDDEAYVDSISNLTDPNRPHLFYGKTSGFGSPVLPSLFGMPADMHQTVGVSDATNRPVHMWNFTWANPDDEAKMKADLEDLARSALGLNPPPAPPTTHTRKSASTRKTDRPAPPPPALAPLADEQFQVFELAYGAGATMVLSAHTEGSGNQEKFVTLVAQPDLYGSVVVLIKNLTDAAHLDDTPRMRLVDAVDARADNRGDLLFELRGATQRQFALYRVLRGEATRIFLSNPENVAIGVAQ